MKFQNLLEYINDHKARTQHLHGWEVVHSKHGKYDHLERHGGELPGGDHEFVGKVVKKIAGLKNPRSGEFMYHSKKHDQAALMNVDHENKQLRVITVLPKGRSYPRPGTQKIMMEGVERDIECVILHDTEFDEAFDQFVTEEFGVGLDEVLESTVLGAGMSKEAKARDVEQSDREYIARRQQREADAEKPLYERTSKEHHTKFANAHKAALEKATDRETKSLHTRGMNLHLKAVSARNPHMSELANNFSKAVKNGEAGVPGIDNVPKHIKDDEMNRRYSSPGAKFRK